MEYKKLMIRLLHNVLSEKLSDINKTAERISIINHQIEKFEKMGESAQETVMKDLVNDLKEYGWQDSIDELEKSKSGVSER